MGLTGIDHVQLAMPEGSEAWAREFYGEILGLPEKAKPPALAARGGVWFEAAELKIHLGVEKDFRPARKAHPALVVRGLPALEDTLRAAGVEVRPNPDQEPGKSAYVDDPFGNRIELVAES